MLEVIAITPDEARAAEQGGAGRIELVSALSEGGLTPGFGLMKCTAAAVRIPVQVMIRPHSRGFHYTAAELEVMGEEIQAARDAGVNGIVLGVLDERNGVDVSALERLLARAGGLEVTFHRAIDESSDPLEAVKLLSRYPEIRNILTSGGPGRIEENTALLAKMKEAAGHLRIMAGGGLTLANAAGIIHASSLTDFHVGTAVRAGHAVHGRLEAERVAEVAWLLASNGVPVKG